jgi:uncharacterized membrane protein
MVANASFVSPTADAKFAQKINQFDTNGIVSTLLNGVNGWTITLTVFLMLVAYDQCKLETLNCACENVLTTPQSSISGTKDRLLGQHSRHPLSDPFSNQ